MTSFRFMSWNWNCFSDKKNQQKAALITRLKPDVVALQEVDDSAIKALKAHLPEWQQIYPPGRRSEGWVTDARKQSMPSVGLIARKGLSLTPLDPPDLTAWTVAPARDGLGLDLENEPVESVEPEARFFVGATVNFEGRALTVVSAHPPHSAGRGREVVDARILKKRRTYAVLREWLKGRSSLVLGMDANAWVDSGLFPLEDPLFLEPGNPQNDVAMFVQNGYLTGFKDDADPVDAFRIWLHYSKNEQFREDIKTRRPNGPWATTYNRSMNHPTPDRRDLVMVSKDVKVLNVEHNYEDSLAAGSDHSYVLCDLTID